MKDVKGKVAFMTGGASGAGLGQFTDTAGIHPIRLDVTDRQAFIHIGYIHKMRSTSLIC